MPQEEDDRLGAGISVDASGPSQAAERVAAVHAAASSADSAAVAAAEDLELGRALSAGSITPAEAQQQLIESVAREELGKDADEMAVRALAEQLGVLMGDDPTLAALLNPRS